MMIHSIKEEGWLCEILFRQVSDVLWKNGVSILCECLEVEHSSIDVKQDSWRTLFQWSPHGCAIG